jgi:steroid 5-alpha reductase family enzyme
MELWYVLGFSVVFNMAMFLIAFRNKTDKLTDISYAATFVGLTVYSLITAKELTLSKWILAFMIILWSVRIGMHLFIRINKTGKDKRFDGMRENFWRFSGFWLIQAVTVWAVLIGSSLYFSSGTKPITAFMAVGIIIWAVGLAVEAVADSQKFQFIQDKKNKGKWIQSGIWKYSRHPNYFGEILVWFGVYVFVVSGLTGSEQLFAMASPLFITFMLLFVSGVPLLEKSADAKWGKDAAYKKYKKSTSVLIPLPPK